MLQSKFAWLLCGGVMACLCAGCNIVGAVAGTLTPPPKVEPEYKPPQQPMLVYVKSPYSSAAGDELASFIIDQLNEHKVAPVVAPEKISELRASKGTQFTTMSIADVGRAVGARQVLYVYLDNVNVEGVTGSDVFRGSVDAHVKMLDVDSGRVLWPTGMEDFDVSKKTDYTRQSTVANTNQVRSMLLQNIGFQIARRFYAYRPEYDTDNMDND